jgi:nucleoside phosphorylase
MRVLILTPLKLELEAVLRHLPGCTAKEVNGAAYWFGTFSGKHTEYEVMVCETGMKVVKMALATTAAVDYFNPQIALVIGIAGGIKSDIKKGDVVIGESIYGYGGGKEEETGFSARPDMERCSDKLVAQSKIIRVGRKWEERIHLAAPDGSQPNVHVGQIAVDDKVVATDKGPTFSLIKKHYNDALCLEMESIGFAHAIQKYKHIEALVIRGISDLCAQKSETDKENWQEVAADRAGGFGFELLWELDTSNIKLNIMDSKITAGEVLTLLFPSPESFKELGNDFSNVDNKALRVLWHKIKPFIYSELVKLGKTPEDVDRQSAVSVKLADELEDNATLFKEIEGLLERMIPRQDPAQSHTTIVGSKNVLVGGTYNVNGDFHLGDKK